MFKKLLSLIFLVQLTLASDVLEFKDSDFESKIAEHSIILVEFFAPWCGHCKKLAPEYEVAATKLKTNDPPLAIAKVDCTAQTETCQKYGVSGYPTLKVFKSGQFAYEYGGERSADGIVKYMISKSGPSCRQLNAKEEFEKFISSSDPVIVGYTNKDSNLEKALHGAADKLNEDFRFAFTNSKDVIGNHLSEESIGIFYPKKLHSKFEDKVMEYKGSVDATSITDWINMNAMGLAGHRTSSNLKFFNTKPLVIAYYNVDYEKNPKGSNYYRNRILKVGKKFLDQGKQLAFAVANSQDMAQELGEYGFDAPDNNKVYIAARDEKNQKFSMKEDFSMEAFEKFLNDLLDGKLPVYLKSEPIPESNTKPVKVVVAKTFDEIVNDPSKDVLIEFYAPWCGHCKSLEPKYDELATKLSDESDIVIAKIDATANDIPSNYEVSGFPTLYFVPKNSKQTPQSYNQGREVDDFLKFIASSATSPLKGFDRQGNAKKSDL